MRRRFAGVIVILLLSSLAACTSGDGTHTQSVDPTSSTSSTPQTSTPPTSSTSGSSQPPSDPRPADGRAATTVYTAFALAARNAERRPSDLARRKALATHAIEPALTSEA